MLTSTIATILGAIVLLIGLGSRRLETSPVPPTVLACLAGILLGPYVLGIVDLDAWGDRATILEDAARVPDDPTFDEGRLVRRMVRTDRHRRDLLCEPVGTADRYIPDLGRCESRRICVSDGSWPHCDVSYSALWERSRYELAAFT